jgi:excisionase family DNA binding protein
MSKDSETQQRPPIERRALSIAETAKTCGLSRATMYRLIANGKLTTQKIGARRVVTVGAIDALLNGARNESK